MTGQTRIAETGMKVPANRNKNAAVEALVEKAVKGDSNALYSLCESVIDSILYHAKYILGNVMDAEDVTQNILLRMCENIRGLREAKAFRAWLGGIEVNETRRFMAEHAKHVNVVNIDDYAEGLWEESAERLPGEYVEGKCPDRSMMEIVSRLPIRQREAVILRYFDDLSVTEVAHAMNISHQNASRYLDLAQKKLRNELKKSRSAAGTGAFAMLPVGHSIFEAFRGEALDAVNHNAPWVHNALALCRNYVMESTAGAAATTANYAEATAVAMRLSLGAMLGILSAIFVVGAVAIGMALGGTGLRGRGGPRRRRQEPGIKGRVVFTGGATHLGTGRINPKRAEMLVEGADGELKVLDWWITPVESVAVLYEGGDGVGGVGGAGDDGVAVALSSLGERGEEGEYNLFYRFEDESGAVYRLLGNFFIKDVQGERPMRSGGQGVIKEQ